MKGMLGSMTCGLFLVGTLAAQDKPQPLTVGTEAPEFKLAGATKDGVLGAPLSLKSLRGHTVVIAFFPKARTGGCTIQMGAYRDQYAKLFGDKDVKVLAISADADTTQAGWAKENNYPVTFLSDLGATVGKQYGVAIDTKIGKLDSRTLYVIDKKGKIVHVMAPFREADPTAYTELGTEVGKAAGGR